MVLTGDMLSPMTPCPDRRGQRGNLVPLYFIKLFSIVALISFTFDTTRPCLFISKSLFFNSPVV